MDSKKTKRKSREENLKFDDLKKETGQVQDLEKETKITKRYEDIIKTKKKGIINVVYYQGLVFKNFKAKEKFAKLVSELGIHKTTIICRIDVFKLCKKYPKLLTSSIGLGFFKDYYKDIKAICEANEKDFQCCAFLPFKTKSVTQALITDIQAKI